MDALNNVVYDDDKQIVELHVYKKIYAGATCTKEYPRLVGILSGRSWDRCDVSSRERRVKTMNSRQQTHHKKQRTFNQGSIVKILSLKQPHLMAGQSHRIFENG
jgi:hypothetical protein